MTQQTERDELISTLRMMLAAYTSGNHPDLCSRLRKAIDMLASDGDLFELMEMLTQTCEEHLFEIMRLKELLAADAPRVPMTDDELRQFRLATEYDGTPSEPLIHRSTHSRFSAFARAVEQFHGITPHETPLYTKPQQAAELTDEEIAGIVVQDKTDIYRRVPYKAVIAFSRAVLAAQKGKQ